MVEFTGVTTLSLPSLLYSVNKRSHSTKGILTVLLFSLSIGTELLVYDSTYMFNVYVILRFFP